MNNLLIDDYPLITLPKLAVKVGINQSIVLQQIHYWVNKQEKAKNSAAFQEGHYWVYNSYNQWKEENFPWMSRNTLIRVITGLEALGLLVTGNFNKAGYDNTKWYRIDYHRLEQLMESPEEEINTDKTTERPAQFEHTQMPSLGKPIPETTRDYKKSSTSGFDLLLEAPTTSATPFEEEYARIRSEPSLRGMENAARDALSSGAPLPIVNSMLAKRIPKGYEQFSATPRFAMKLHSYENSKAAGDFKLATLWKAIAEDVGGVDYSEQSKTFSELRGAYKKILLSKYSYDQCIWTLRRVVKNTSNLSFLSKGGRNLVTLVQQNSKEYHDLRTEAKKLEAMEKAQEERRAVKAEQPKEEAPPIEVSLKDNPLMLSLFQNAKNKGK